MTSIKNIGWRNDFCIGDDVTQPQWRNEKACKIEWRNDRYEVVRWRSDRHPSTNMAYLSHYSYHYHFADNKFLSINCLEYLYMKSKKKKMKNKWKD